jgi:hypothetical protein
MVGVRGKRERTEGYNRLHALETYTYPSRARQCAAETRARAETRDCYPAFIAFSQQDGRVLCSFREEHHSRCLVRLRG